jgi:hypothetical protein
MASLSILTFGDVFRYKEKDYVYLASTEDIIFTARIFSPQETYDISELARRFDNNPRTNRSKSELYYFVILNTKEVKDRMASLANTGNNDVSVYADKYCKLAKEDLRSIKEKIIDPETPISGILRDLIRDIEISD